MKVCGAMASLLDSADRDRVFHRLERGLRVHFESVADLFGECKGGFDISIFKPGALKRVVCGEDAGTTVTC